MPGSGLWHPPPYLANNEKLKVQRITREESKEPPESRKGEERGKRGRQVGLRNQWEGGSRMEEEIEKNEVVVMGFCKQFWKTIQMKYWLFPKIIIIIIIKG
jgi:hypothetical protein